MIRRTLLLGILGLGRKDETKLPQGDVEAFNRFAAIYNEFIEQLRADKADVRLWRRTLEAWKDLQ